MNNEIINKIISEISFYDGAILQKHKLSDDLGIDSLRMVELIVALEERFNIIIKEDDMDLDKLHTVNDIYLLINKYTK